MKEKLDVAFVRGSGADLTLSVLGSFQFRFGDSAPALPTGSQRLLAFLALRDRSVTRLSIAGTLWPDASEQHAAASLRSALTRLRGEARAAVEVGDLDIHLASGVRVDIRESKMLAHRLLEPDAPRMDPDAAGAAISALSSDLPPDWYEDWVLMETAEWRQLRLHALEAVAEHLSKEGRWAQAIAAAQAAIRAEPLRETSHAALVRVFIAEGNQIEAISQYERYRTLLNDELGLEPTNQISDLVRDLGRRRADETGRDGSSRTPHPSSR